MSNVHFDLSFNLYQGKVYDFSGEEPKNIRGGARPSQGRGTPPLKIRL
jgi:hypothetical protein